LNSFNFAQETNWLVFVLPFCFQHIRCRHYENTQRSSDWPTWLYFRYRNTKKDDLDVNYGEGSGEEMAAYFALYFTH
jgi:hypothetical protein